MKSLFEQMGGTYSQQGDYLISNIKSQAKESTNNIRIAECGLTKLHSAFSTN